MARHNRNHSHRNPAGESAAKEVENGRKSKSADPSSGARSKPAGDQPAPSSPQQTREKKRYVRRVNARFLGLLVLTSAVVLAGIHFLHAHQVERNADVLLERANAARDAGEPQKAIGLLSQYVRFRPNDVNALADLGTLIDENARSARDWLQAYLALDQVLRDDINREDASEIRRRLAELAIKLRRFREASDDYLPQLLQEAPEDAELLSLMAGCQQAQGKDELAAVYLMQAISADPSNVDYYLALVELVRSRSEQIPSQAEIGELKGTVESPRQNQLLAQLPAIDPNLLATLPAESDELLQVDQSAEQILAQMIQHGRPQHRALLARAGYYRQRDRLDDAETDIQSALQQAGEEADVLLAAAQLAIARSQQRSLEGDNAAAKGDLQLAQDYVDKGLQLDDVRFHRLDAELHVRHQEWSQAAESLDDGLTLLAKGIDLPDNVDVAMLEIDLRWQLADVLISSAQAQGSTPDPVVLAAAQTHIDELEMLVTQPFLIDYLDARIEMTHGRRHEASLLLEQARPQLQQFPEIVKRIDLLLGECYGALSNPDAQLAVYRRALKADPLWLAGRMQLAAALAAAGRTAEAVEEYRSMLTVAPVVSIELARLLILEQLDRPVSQRQWEPVAQLLDRIAEQLETELPQVTVLRAEVLLLQDRPAEAAAMLRTSSERSPDETSYWASLALLELRRTDVDQADRYDRTIRILDEARQHVDLSSDLLQARAAAARLLDNERAVQDLQEIEAAASLEPAEQDQLREALARHYAALGETTKATQLWETIAQRNPQQLGPQLALGQFHLRAGDEESFKKTLDEIRRIEGASAPHGNYFEAMWLLSQAQRDETLLGDPDQLQTALNKPRELLRRTQRQRLTWPAVRRALGDLDFLLAKAEEARGQNKEAADHQKRAVDAYRQAIQLGERSPEMLRRVVEHYYALQQFDEADLVLRQVSNDDPELISGDLARQAWRVAWSRQQYDEAIGIAGNLADQSGDVRDKIWQANLQAARFRLLPVEQRQKEDLDAILELYRDAVDAAPEDPETWLAYILNLQQNGRTEQAREAVHEAAEKLPEQPPHLKPLSLARFNDIVQATEQAGKLYEIAIQAAPNEMTTRFLAAEFFHRTGDEVRVQQQLDYILDPANKAPQVAIDLARRTKALLLARKGGYQQATEALEMLRQPLDGMPTAEISPADLRAQAMILARRLNAENRRQLTAILEELARRKAATTEERFQLARLYEADDKWPQADQLFQSLLQENPAELVLVGYYTQGLLRQKLLDEAQPWLQRFDQLAPNTFAGVMLHALYARAEGSTDEAVRQITEFFDSHQPAASPDQAVRELLVQNDVDEALAAIKTSLDPAKDAEALKSLEQGREFLQQGNTEAAALVLRQVVARQDIQRAIDAYYLRAAARVLASFDRHDAAEQLYRQYMEISQKPEDALTLAAYITRQGRTEDALLICQQAWDTCPAAAVANTSVAVLREGDPTPEQMARVGLWLEEASQEDPNAAAPLVHLADLYDLQERYDDAETLYRRVLLTNGTNVMALNNLAWLLALRGSSQNEDPLQLIDRAVELAGPHAELLDTRAFVLLQTGQPKQAVAVLEQAIAESPSPVKHFHLAQAYSRLGNAEEARRQFQNALDAGLTLDRLHPLEHAAFQKLQNSN